MKIFLLLATFLVTIISCNAKKEEPINNVNDKVTLLEADQAFSRMSVEKGMKTAFIEYMDSNGVLLRPNQLPIVGANAIDFLVMQNDDTYTMNWQPQNAFVSRSGDLGYTYGVYALRPKNADTVLYGTYVSIWKKQPDGTWKFALDSGNEGVDSNAVAF